MSQRVFGITVSLLVLLAVLLTMSLATAAETDDSDPGYIDSALIRNRLRVRVDAGWDLNRPDRAEFFYGSWANLADHPHAIKDTDELLTVLNDRGTIFLPESVDFQELSTYLEIAYQDRASVFAELPIRFIQFIGDGEDPNAFSSVAFRNAYDRASRNPQGVSDLQLGFKFAMVNDEHLTLTMQIRTFIPTGKSRDGLGTGHVSIEPGLLSQLRLSEDVAMMGQAKLWTPVDAGANAGNVAIYGAGLRYDRMCNRCYPCKPCVVPMIEFVGWTVLDGFETLSSPDGLPVVPNSAQVPFIPDNINEDGVTQLDANGGVNPLIKDAPTSHGVQDATGKTIINAKIGFRTLFGLQDSVYLGYGRVLTGSRWYRDAVRIEFQRLF